MKDIRNVAIIAHVDHGKTTLVDALLKQSKTKLNKNVSDSLIMDSNELEQERGITIFSKNASILWNDPASPDASQGGTKINIIDTPGHADFGGEVERVLTMAQGCLLLIDAKEGPMPQTRFVLKKALEMKLKIIVVINKIDKKDARIDYVLDKTLDLFLELGADDKTAYFPTVYASAKGGVAGLHPKLSEMTDITPIFETILKEIPSPNVDKEKPLQMLITTLSSDSHKGRIAIGRIYNGTLKTNQEVAQITKSGEIIKTRLTSLMTFEGLEKIDADEALAGDIVAVSGIKEPIIGETISDPINPIALPRLDVDEPTIKMTFMVNDSPFGGREGEYKTSRQIRDRLYKELETDMALLVEDNPDGTWSVSGRGELHLAILIERMRREGYEFQVSHPQVINKVVNGKALIPYERVFIEVPDELSGVVIQKMGARRGELKDISSENGVTFLEFIISTRGLFGYRSEFITDTRGLGIINTSFYEYAVDNGYNHEREQGSLIAHENGVTNLYSLTNIQNRGQLFVGPAVAIYKGQVIGRNSRIEDISVNACKTKQLTNHRSKGEGVSEYFKTPKEMGLEDAIGYIADDELVEITPQSIRIRKTILDEIEARRKKAQGII
ncbi:MAG: translational GTPase TypA [Candidatus Levybacteria bacterium]|nr:translational GTPase TypA [Candidatus Levybacteria bacterium]